MKKIFTLYVLFVLAFISASGQTAGDFRSKLPGPGNWADYTAWERFDGTSWVAATSGQLPTATSAVEIQNGYTMTLNGPGLLAKTLTVNGSLTYHATTVSTLTVSGSVTVGPLGRFTSPSTGTVVTHVLNIGGSTATGVGGDLIVNGTFNMNAFSTAGVAVTFWGTSNNVITGTGSVINFYSITVSKGTGNYNSILDVTSVITIAQGNATNGNRIYAQVGSFRLSSASVLEPFYGSPPLMVQTMEGYGLTMLLQRSRA